MEKRVLLAVFLSFLVLFAYQALVPQPKPKPKPKATAPITASTAASTKPAATPGPAAVTAAASPDATVPATSSSPTAAARVGETVERRVVVETKTVIATFDNRGARLLSWRLKDYRNPDGQLVDIVPAHVPASEPRPFELKVEDAALTARMNDGLYRARVNGSDAGERVAIQAPTTVTFELQDAQGLSVTKSFGFAPNGYIVTYSSSVSDGTRTLNPVLLWGPGLGDTSHVVGQKSSNSYVQYAQAILRPKGGKVLRLPFAMVPQQPSHLDTFSFAGVDDHYFIAMLVDPGKVRVQYEAEQVPIPGTSERHELVSWTTLFAQPPRDVRFFVGPKDFEILKAVDPGLIDTIYFGIFQVLAVPLLNALKSINHYVGNYGWSIIILTFLINVVLFPLRHKSVVSMRKMQEVQPEIKAIQDRYAKYKTTDPERQKMNEELMKLYREKGVSPASGCVPMLLTMPVLFAFYSLLSVAIEMRGAPFALWITDLSVHDPYYITPLIMAGSMLWQQRMTPVADPTQAKVAMLMPVMFLFFFLWAPSGLVIYWTVSNLLGIAQQKATYRIIGQPVVKQVRPPAERKVKNAGGGSTPAARNASSPARPE